MRYGAAAHIKGKRMARRDNQAAHLSFVFECGTRGVGGGQCVCADWSHVFGQHVKGHQISGGHI